MRLFTLRLCFLGLAVASTIRGSAGAQTCDGVPDPDDCGSDATICDNAIFGPGAKERCPGLCNTCCAFPDPTDCGTDASICNSTVFGPEAKKRCPELCHNCARETTTSTTMTTTTTTATSTTTTTTTTLRGMNPNWFLKLSDGKRAGVVIGFLSLSCLIFFTFCYSATEHFNIRGCGN